MARASQLPSGAWRVRVTDPGTGKRISITAPTEREANYKALEFELGKDRKARIGKTVGEAIDDYIALKDGVLSPTTIQGYRKIRRVSLQGLMDIPVKNLTQQQVQAAINEECKRVSPRTGRRQSPKSIHNMHGLLSAALSLECPDFVLKTTLPAKQKRLLELPPAADIIRAVKGTDVELPVLFALWLSLSMSEIRGLTVSALHGDVLYIEQVVVDVDGLPVVKSATKAYERTREHRLPQEILRLIEQTEAYRHGSGFLVTTKRQTLIDRFHRYLAAAGVPKITFHQLRHLNASVMLALGVPNLYAQERGGWSTDHTLKSVYQHTFSAERSRVDSLIDDFFKQAYRQADTKVDTALNFAR